MNVAFFDNSPIEFFEDGNLDFLNPDYIKEYFHQNLLCVNQFTGDEYFAPLYACFDVSKDQLEKAIEGANNLRPVFEGKAYGYDGLGLGDLKDMSDKDGGIVLEYFCRFEDKE